MKINFEKAANKGFTRWTKGDKDRLYFNIADNGILDIDRYKSGNIHHAYLDGEKISNSRASRIIATSAYLDLKTGETFIDNGDEHDLVAAIFKKAIKKVEEVEEVEEVKEVEKPKNAKKLNDVSLSSKLEKADDEAEVLVNGVYMGTVKLLEDHKLILTTTGAYGDQIQVDYDDLDEFMDDMQTIVFDDSTVQREV